MSGATRVHVQRGARWASRGCAALTALWLVVCGVLGLRHRSVVDHVRDDQTGEVRHAASSIGPHAADAANPDFHARRDSGGSEAACHLGAAHQAGGPLVAWSPVVQLARRPLGDLVAASQRTGAPRRVFRIAPKTSPPAA
jgi:hypothetical protein